MSFEEYHITSLGFLPEKCHSAPPSGWEHLQILLDNLSSNNVQKFRRLVESLPPYSPETYSLEGLSDGEKRFLYNVLTMITQKYIWGCGSSNLMDVITPELGLPLLDVSKCLGLPPTLTYAGTILYNWRLKDESKPISLDNLEVLYKMTEGVAYEWFCMVHTAIEAFGGKVVRSMMKTKSLMKEGNDTAIKEILKEVSVAVKNSEDTLMRMYEHCSPQEFWTFRFYFEGTNDPNLFPKGLRIKGVENKSLSFRGASGGQSTLVKAFDAFFSITHEGHGKGFLEEMKSYMPPEHKQYLEDLEYPPNLKDYVERSRDEELRKFYKEAVDKFIHYRQSHFRLVHDYIFQIVEKNKFEMEKKIEEEPNLYKQNSTGTGGTDPRVFLKKLIHETRAAKEGLKPIAQELQSEVMENKVRVKVSVNRRKAEDFLMSVIMAIIACLILKVFWNNVKA